MSDSIKDLKFDNKNFNKHTQFGMGLLERSLRENGAGRSILIDKDNNIIAGNGIVEAAGSIGLENVKVVETDGKEIIAVKRTDISIDSEAGRNMALADNATAAADLEWDEEALRNEFDEEELEGWGVVFPKELTADGDLEGEDDGPEASRVVICSVDVFGRSKDEDAVLIGDIPQETADKVLEAIKAQGSQAVAGKIIEALNAL